MCVDSSWFLLNYYEEKHQQQMNDREWVEFIQMEEWVETIAPFVYFDMETVLLQY